MPQLGEKIRLFRQSKGFTQEQLVEGIAKKSTLSQIESGKASPSIELLLQIADRLDVGIGELLKDVTWDRRPSDLLKLANVLFDKQEYSIALTYFQQVRSEEMEEEEDPSYLYKLSICYTETGDADQALLMLERLVALAVSRGLHTWRGQAFQQIGQVYFKQQNYKLAEHYWLKAEDRISLLEDPDPAQTARLFNRLGVVNFYLGEHEKSVEYYLKALEILNGSEYVFQQSITMMNMAISLNSLGDYERAAEMYQKLENVNEEVGPLVYAIIRFHYAVFLADTGRYKAAEKLFLEVRQRFEEMGEESWLAEVDTEIAELCLKRGDYENSLKLCERLLDQLSADHSEYGNVQRIQGLIHMEQGQYEKAIPAFVSALQFFERLGRLDQVRDVHKLLTVCIEKKSLKRG
ncbi:tetratricopeptide repeat protein [Effusibacillus consociatus]|uniref:Tetratricopeptide repeat protein n=1 Tax=Effusibacillus consociatus TaxID=1117041 RepID=A0ABV9Q0T0_9BACL